MLKLFDGEVRVMLLSTCFAHAGKRRVGVAGHDQFVVYFVTHYHDVVA